MRYFARIRDQGAVRHWRYPSAIGVHASPFDSAPIGMAFGAGRTDAGLALWRVEVDGDLQPGRFVIVDGEFLPAQ
jgi:hypothetical protein